MLKRVAVDVSLGLLLAVLGQFAQLFAGVVGEVLGLPFPYEMAPEDGSIPQALLDQINLMFWLAGVVMLVLSFVLGWLLKVDSPGLGLQRGGAWALVVALSQLLLGLGGGVVPVFGLPGVYGYLAAVVLGAVVVGFLRRGSRSGDAFAPLNRPRTSAARSAAERQRD